MKTLSTSEMTHGLLILHTPENLEDKEYIFTFHQDCFSAPPPFFYIINSGTQNKKIRSVKKLN